MDTLTFNTPILLRHLTFSEAKKMPISEINLEKALEGLEMNMDQVSLLIVVHLLLLSVPLSIVTNVCS
jgi:flap endonuclease-1